MINFNQLETLNKCLIDWNVNYSVYPYNGYTINEVLCQFFDAINKGIITINEYTKLISAIMNWIKDEGLKEEVEKALDKMIEDGTLDNIINKNLFGDILDRIQKLETSIYELDSDLVNGNIPQRALRNKLLGCSLYYPYDSSQYGSYTDIIDKMVKMNCNYLQFSPILKMETETSNTIYSDLNTEYMNEIVGYAKSKGMKVCLKCHIKANGLSGHSHIRPTDVSAWIKSLKNITISLLNQFKNNIDIVSLSNECRLQTSKNKDEWVSFNNDVKELGYKTTIATTNDEFTENVLKDVVDYLGLNMYVGIDYNKINSDSFEHMFYSDVNHDNDDFITLINEYCDKYNKKCIITELGILPCLENYYSPAIWTYNGDYNEVAQSNYISNALKVLLSNSSIEGVAIWNVCDGFTILNRLSETTVKNIYGGVKNV